MFFVSLISANMSFEDKDNRLGFEVDTGTRRNDYMIDFVNPRVNDSLWSMGVDGQSVRRVFDGFDRDELGGGFNFGYPILSFLGDEFEQSSLTVVSPSACATTTFDRLLLSFTPSSPFKCRWCGNINPLSIAYASQPRLRSRLTLGRMAWPRKPWVYGGVGFHHP